MTEQRPWYLVFSMDEEGRVGSRIFSCLEGDAITRARAWIATKDEVFLVAFPFLANSYRKFFTEFGEDNTEDLDHVRV